MDFEKATTGAKAWKDIWGCGQGIGAIKEVLPAEELIASWVKQYKAAKTSLCQAE